MSHGPSTLGIITTSSLFPISGIRRRKSSRTHGLSRLLTRVHSAVSPKSVSLASSIRPSRATSLRSAGIASSRLPRMTSVFPIMSGTLETIFSLLASRKWIIREGLTGISSGGSGGYLDPAGLGAPVQTDQSQYPVPGLDHLLDLDPEALERRHPVLPQT